MNPSDPMTTPGRQAAIEAAVRELSHDRVTKPHVLDPDREARLVIDAYERVLTEQPRGEPTCDCGHAADDHDNVRPNGERLIDGRETPCERCSCIDFQAAEQPEGEAVLRVEWLHEEFENRSSPMVWPKCGPASATHRRLVSDWMPIVRSAK